MTNDNGTRPAGGAIAITQSDSTDLTPYKLRGLYIGVSGDVSVNMIESGTATIVFKSVPIGILPIRPAKVLAATTATNIIGLF